MIFLPVLLSVNDKTMTVSLKRSTELRLWTNVAGKQMLLESLATRGFIHHTGRMMSVIQSG